ADYGPLVRVLIRALQRDPKARYSSASDFGRALSALLPDPITARDEVTRFYERLDALEEGRQRSSSASITAAPVSQGSILPEPSAVEDEAPLTAMAMALTGVVVVALTALLLAGVVGVGALLFGRTPLPTDL